MNYFLKAPVNRSPIKTMTKNQAHDRVNGKRTLDLTNKHTKIPYTVYLITILRGKVFSTAAVNDLTPDEPEAFLIAHNPDALTFYVKLFAQ